MSLNHCDGFEAYDAANIASGTNTDLAQVWSATSFCQIRTTGARSGDQCLRVGGAQATSSLSRARKVFAAATQAFCGFSIYNDRGTWQDDFQYSLSGGATKMSLKIDGSGRILLQVNDATVLTSSFTLAVKTHHFFEMGYKGGVSGIMQIRLEGHLVFEYTGAFNETVSQFEILGGAQALAGFKQTDFDDFYLVLNDGNFPTGYLGVIKTLTRTFIADLGTPDWISTEATLFDALNGNSKDSYIEAGAIDDLALFELSDGGNEIAALYGATVFYGATKTDAGEASIYPFLERDGQTLAGIINPLSTGDTIYSATFSVDPKSGLQQSKDQLNETNLGFVRVS